MEIPRYWRDRKTRYRLVVNEALVKNNPWVGWGHADSSEKRINDVHEKLLEGEIDVEQAIADSLLENMGEK